MIICVSSDEGRRLFCSTRHLPLSSDVNATKYLRTLPKVTMFNRKNPFGFAFFSTERLWSLKLLPDGGLHRGISQSSVLGLEVPARGGAGLPSYRPRMWVRNK